MNKVTLLLGGNEGDRALLIDLATEQIRERIGSVVASSRLYETEPWGEFEAENGERRVANFLNCALVVETTLSPWQVLRAALAIEKDLGRQRPPLFTFHFSLSTRKYHSRPMDIDLIFYDDLVVDSPELTLPHPRMHLRRFVLDPLAELMPDYRHPLLGKTVRELQARQGVGVQAGVERSVTPEHTASHISPEPPKGVDGVRNKPVTHSVGSKHCIMSPTQGLAPLPGGRRPFGAFAVLFLLLLIPLVVGAQTATVSGTVTDAKTGETLIGATVLDTRSGKGAVTNAFGHYSLTLRRDTVSLKVSFVGYESQTYGLRLDGNRELNVRLAPSVMLSEVTITAERTGDTRSSQMSATVMTVEKIKSVPVMFGEADLIKALQLMPGVQSGSEGNSGMYVRGGGPDENLFLLDGVPLYNVSHMGGFFSTFNTDAVKNVTLYKGSFPARFGGRLSAVLDVTQNNGNDQELHGNVSIGLISAKVNVEGPIVKERTTFSFSARRTYAELFIIPAIMWLNDATSEEETAGPAVAQNAKFDAGYWFYDLNAKVTHKFGEGSRLYASFYMGDDKIHGKVHTVTSLDEDMNLGFANKWGNLVASLRWNYALTPRLFMNLSASYTQYKNNIEGTIEKHLTPNDPNASTIDADYRSGIKEATARADFDFVPSPEHSVKYGGAFTRHWFTPEVADASVHYFDSIQMNKPITMDTAIMSGTVPANEMALYVEDDWAITEALKLNYGLHLSGFHVQESFYASLQPRLSARMMLTDDLSVKAGYARMTQYVHLLSTTSVTLPTDLWVPVTDRVKPMTSDQVAAGICYSRSGIADVSVEAYWKKMDNIIEYKDGATFFGSSENWENLVYGGEGWSYGVEFLVQREVGDLTGWIGYTWSRTMHRFDRPGQKINGGEPFPAKYDRRHDLSVVLNYRFSDRVDVSATWVFSTGNAASLATQSYPVAQEEAGDYDHGGGGTVNVIEGRNNYRMPSYHRLDLGVNFHRRFKHARRTLSVSIYNVYNRQNPYMLYRSRTTHYKNYPTALVQLSIFPILPSVGYTLYF